MNLFNYIIVITNQLWDINLAFVVMMTTDFVELQYAADLYRAIWIMALLLKLIAFVLIGHIMLVQNYMALANALQKKWDLKR